MAKRLTAYEIQLVSDSKTLLAKNRIINKVCEMFGSLADEYQQSLNKNHFNTSGLVHAKVSKGEQYKGLPYVVLDYPRQFGKVNTFAIRTFFWWGNFFSISLHLSGNYLQQSLPTIQSFLPEISSGDWYISTGDDQWQHHFGEDNYETINASTVHLENRSFIKLAKKFPLHQWENVNQLFTNNFDWLLTSICIKLQFDETNL